MEKSNTTRCDSKTDNP